MATCLIGSYVQDNARYPFEILRSVPSENWSEELQRFFNQLKDLNAISAMDFFFLCKKMLIGLTGALITYELVLLQFNSEEVDWDRLVDCNF